MCSGAVLFWRFSLTMYSWTSRVLSAMGSRECCYCNYRGWLVEHIFAHHKDCDVGDLPDDRRIRPWVRDANGNAEDPCLAIIANILQAMLAIQTTLSPQQTSIGLAILIFGQGLGGALFQSFSQIALTNGLKNALPVFAPNVDVQAVIDAGATGLAEVISPADLKNVLLAYSQAVNHVFYLTTGAAFAGFVFSWGLGWVSVKEKKVVAPEA